MTRHCTLSNITAIVHSETDHSHLQCCCHRAVTLRRLVLKRDAYRPFNAVLHAMATFFCYSRGTCYRMLYSLALLYSPPKPGLTNMRSAVTHEQFQQQNVIDTKELPDSTLDMQ
jgi:hypothetical protein